MQGSDQMQDGGKFLQLVDKHDIMGKILRLCSKKDQHAAYLVCKGLRDACNHNIRTVETIVEVVNSSTVRGQSRRLGSYRLCPEGADNIKSLHVICKQEPTGRLKQCTNVTGVKDDEAIIYLQQLLDTQAEIDRIRHSKQLSTVTELAIALSLTNTQAVETPCQCVARLLDLMPNVRQIRADHPALTALLMTAHQHCTQILSLIIEDIRPLQLYCTSNLFPNLLNLDIKFVTEVVLPTELAQLTNLVNLHISISHANTDTSYVPHPVIWAPLAGLTKLQRFSLVVGPDYQTSVTFPAQYVAGLAQLQELILNGCMISNHCLLAIMPWLRSLQLGCAYTTCETTNIGLITTASCWPALQCLTFLGPVTESVVRALCLPSSHTQLKVSCAARHFVYNVDRAADAQSGFMGVTCMAVARAEKVDLSGAFASSA